LLTGKYPLDFRRGKDLLRILLEEEPIPIRERKPDIPAALARVVDRAVRKKAKERYQTAEEFKQALLEAL